MALSLYQIKEFVCKMGIKLCMLHQATSTTPFLSQPNSVISSPGSSYTLSHHCLYTASHQADSGKIAVLKAKLSLDKKAATSANIASKV